MASFSSSSSSDVAQMDAKLGSTSLSGGSGSGSSSTLEWPANRIRSTFINYFKERRGHTFVPSSPVVPLNDPTLLFANAGMNQFKPLFLGTCDPTLEMSKLKMAVNSQKCIRAGGKHNDLEDVGKDVYHHTFFEMLGNWSFGSYFKEEAITWAFECLTEVYGIDKERLYATYFGGDASQGLAVDEEAKAIWLRFLPEARVLPFGCKDNFWEMGATGPCGPCTEIHFDRIGGRDAAALVNADRPDVIEIWNNVFIQFNRETDGSLKELPNKHVDTGMGFERLSSILQGKDSNYDTDIFTPIFEAIRTVCKCREYTALVGADDKDLVDMAYRVIGDHIRTLTFAITDGAMPASDGRGYVLRRILRRAVRYGQEILGAPGGFFTKLVPVVVEHFSSFFPELRARKDYVMSVISDEELSFMRTLDQGVKHFNKVVAAMTAQGSKIVPAKDAHLLFGSMGFPLDLTELMAAERGFTVDTAGFQELMDSDRRISELAALARKGGGSKDLSMVAEQTSWLQGKGIASTDSSSKYTWDQTLSASVVALYIGRGGQTAGFVDSITPQDGTVGVILNATSFYYESGGQIYDTGVLAMADGSKFVVENSQTYAGYVVHVGYLEGKERMDVGTSVSVSVDYQRRALVAPNHTMTHVLNYALKTVLIGGDADKAQGGMCDQRGSLVDTEKLRFDFTWNGPVSAVQLAQVEKIVCEQVAAGLPVYAEVVALEAASKIHSLRMVPDEKYPDPVRVISVGQDVQALIANPLDPSWSGLSIEFCGGTHLINTKQAEAFVLIEESGIQKGVRRIVGLTRQAALGARALASQLSTQVATLEGMVAGSELSGKAKVLKLEIDQAVISVVDKDQLKTRMAAVSEKLRVWNKANTAAKVAEASIKAEQVATAALAAGKAVLVLQVETGGDGKVAKKIQESIRKIHASASFMLVSLDEEADKVGLFPLVSAEHISTSAFSAKEWCEHCIAVLGAGKGGGKADSALANIPGGQDVADAIIKASREFATSKMPAVGIH